VTEPTENTPDQTAAPELEIHRGPGGKHDPRSIALVRVGDVSVDQRVQRPIDSHKVAWLGSKWDWTLAEGPTLSRRPDGTLVAVEGQHRILSLQAADPDTEMWMFIENLAGTDDEAATALGIARGRRPHSRVQEYRMRVTAGLPHEVAADQVLDELGLVISETRSGHSLTSAVMIMRIIHGTTSAPLTPQEGAGLLRATLSCIQMIPDDPTTRGNKYDSTIIHAVSTLISEHPEISLQRLAEKLQARTATQWLAFRQSASPAWHGVYQVIKADYNKNTKSSRLA